MSKSSKIKINFTANYGEKTLKFKNVTVAKSTTGYGWAPMAGTSSVIRQFVKQMWPDVKFRISSDTFSGGNSVTVYIQEQVSQQMFDEIRDTLKNFQSGRFDGMTDSYNYIDGRGISVMVGDTKYTFDTKYMTVQNSPKYGTPEYETYWNNQ